MPLEKIILESGRAWALWRITEDEHTLTTQLAGDELISPSISNQYKRLEWLAGRILVKRVFASMSLAFLGITKDEHGKPSPTGHDYHMSLSHSFPFVATLIDKFGPAGIDLEQPKEKLLRIAPRILNKIELEDAGNDLTKHCIYWCAKEALIKIHGKKNLVFAENLSVDPFELGQEGNIRGRIIIERAERIVDLKYFVYPNFVMVFNKPMAL